MPGARRCRSGRQVRIISGPVHLAARALHSYSGDLRCRDARARTGRLQSMRIFYCRAAVADYRPVDCGRQKIKKHADSIELKLEKNPDIVSAVGREFSNLFVVGFAAETQDIETYARDKLERKKLDAIVANDVSRSGRRF